MTLASDQPVVELSDIWRRYRLADGGRTTSLRATIGRGPGAWRTEWFWALRGVDLAVHRGRATAVIGPNGAGKSSLLRLAGGIGRPDRGSVRVRGRIGAMLDLGREFHPDLTGRQNAELAAVVAGLTRREFRRRFEAMIDFAGLHDFTDQPLRSFSDGLRARLDFAVLSHVDPEVLLVDEVLAVGDAAFQQRSVERIDVLRGRGVGIVFVSHDLSLVRRVCDEAVWLQGGTVHRRGEATAVVADYLSSATEPRSAVPEPPQTGTAISDFEVLDEWGVAAAAVRSGDGLRVRWHVTATSAERPLHVSVVLERAGGGRRAVDTSTTLHDPEESFTVDFERLDLAPGDYEVVIGLFDQAWGRCLAEERRALLVRGDGPDGAALAPPHEWSRRRR